jgi:iron complex outermembrane recepter protein
VETRAAALNLFLIGVCSTSLGLAAVAQDANGVEPVLVTAPAQPLISQSLTSANFDTVNQQFLETPGAIGAFSADQYQLGRGAYLEDFLPYVPGVLIASAQGTEDTKISIRGSNAQDDDIIGLGVLIDGTPLNQGDGEAYLQDLDLRSVKYAEVYRGADALRYGSLGLGGAVNFVTMTGREAPPFETWLSGGSYGFLEAGILSGWSNGPMDGIFTASTHLVDGFRDHSQEDSEKIFISLGDRLSSWAENRFYFFWGRLSQNNPSSVSEEAMMSNPRQTSPESIAQDWSTDWNYVRLLDQLVLQGNDWQFRAGAFYNHRNDLQRQEFDADNPIGIVRYYSDDFGGNLAFESTADLFDCRNRFTAGLNLAFEDETDTNYANLSGNIGPLISADQTFAANITFYGENQHYLTKSVSFVAGFQAVYVERDYRDRLDNPLVGNQTNFEAFRGLSPKLGLLYEYENLWKAYTTLSWTFQPPSFDQSQQAAPDGDELFNRLNPQEGVTIEVGTKGQAGAFQWDVAFYHTWLRDELLDLTNGEGVPIGTVNAGKTFHQGVEFGLETELGHGFLVRGADADGRDRLILVQTYTFSDFRFQKSPVYGSNRIAGTPVHFYKAELRYEQPSGFYFGANVEWNLMRYPVDEANTLFAGPYALLGCRFGYKIRKGFSAYVDLKNLTNRIYAATVEPVGNARIEGGNSFNPGNGRAVYSGISYAW